MLVTLLWLGRILYSYRILGQQRHSHEKNTAAIGSYPPIHIILPILNEEKRLAEFVNYFTNTLQQEYPELELWIITTERERTEYTASTTIELAKNFSISDDNIHHLHYPHTKGVMAHQLNYAVERMPLNGLYAIYNADSRPEPKTFSWIARQYDNTKQMLFQQYGIYTKNYSYIKAQKTSFILISNMYWQCRWAIGFEYYRAASAIQRKHWPVALRTFNYCIGHGLFISADLIKELRFSEATTNEDAILGLEASLRHIPIQPLPYFDLSESPDSISSIYHQKTNWYQGPYQSALYYRLLHVKYPAIGAFSLALSCLKLFSHAIYWIIGPFIVTSSILIAIILSIVVAPHVYFLFFVLAPLSFLVLPTLFVHVSLERLGIAGYTTKKENRITYLLKALLIGGVPSYIVHGVAGARGLLMSKKILHGNKIKTKMVQYGEA